SIPLVLSSFPTRRSSDLAAVISCGFVLDVSMSFPGYAALWPSLGAALVLGSGAGMLPGSARKLLSLRPLLWLGGISYAFYLWHRSEEHTSELQSRENLVC